MIPTLIAAALCLLYIVWPHAATGVAVAIGGLVLAARFPETALMFLGLGWVAERQVLTYASGIPFLIAGLVGPAIRFGKALPALARDYAFVAFVGVTTAYCMLTIATRPAWQSAGWNRLLFVAIAIGVYSLCTSSRARRVFEDASIACGVVVSINAIVATGLFTTEAILHTGGDIASNLVDSNYGSIPIVFGLALALERLLRRRLLGLNAVLHAGAVLVNLWALLLLASRGAEVATAMVLLAWAGKALFGRRLSRIGRWAGVAAIVLIGVAAYTAVRIAGADVLEENQARWESVTTEGASGRIDLATSAFAAIAAHPIAVILGGGIGYNLDVLGGQSVHNQLLDSLFDCGLAGLVALLWIWLKLLSAGLRKTDGRHRAIRAPVLPAMGVGVCGLALAPLWFGFFWVELGYLAARVGPAARARVRHRRHRRHSHHRSHESTGDSVAQPAVAAVKDIGAGE